MPGANTGRANISARSAKRAPRAAVLVLLFIYLLYPRLTAFFLPDRTAPAPVEATTERPAPRDAFDQSHVSDVEWQEQPIVAVPNDYTE